MPEFDQIAHEHGEIEHVGVMQRINSWTQLKCDVDFQDGHPLIRHLLTISQYQMFGVERYQRRKGR